MSVQGRIAKLEALLARVSVRAGEPRNGHAAAAIPAPEAVAAPVAVATPAPAPVARPLPTRVEAIAVLPSGLPVVHAAPVDEVEEIEAVDFISTPPPVAVAPAPVVAAAADAPSAPAAAEMPAGDEPLESRERLVAAPAVDELTDVASLPPVSEREERPSDPTMAQAVAMTPSDAPVLEVASEDSPDLEVSAEILDGGTVEVEVGDEEPPASSRRPIALEPPLEELAFGDAGPTTAPHTPPPESGRQVAASAYPEAVQQPATDHHAEDRAAAAAEPAESLAQHTPANGVPAETAPATGLDFDGESTGVRAKPEVEAAPAAPRTVPPPASAPPPAAVAAAPAPVAALSPQVVRPALDAANVAVFVGKAREFEPTCFGDLLDATLAL